MKLKLGFICFVLFIAFLYTPKVLASSTLESYEDVQAAIDQSECKVSFSSFVELLKKGDLKGAKKLVLKSFIDQFTFQWKTNHKFLKQMILIGIIAAIFQNFSSAFFQGTSSETAFYVCYLSFITCMANSFYYLSSVMQTSIDSLLDFMKGFMSAFCLAIVATSGVNTSIATYQVSLGILYVVSMGLRYLLLPGIKIFFLAMMMNHLTKENRISKLCDGIEWLMKMLLKSALGIIMGIQLIQSMLLPVIDSMKSSAVQKGVSLIPGVGKGVQTVTNTLIGAAVIIKNAVGVGGILVITIYLIRPLLQLVLTTLVYMATQVLLQPISDVRIVGIFDGMIRSMKLYIQVLIMISILFILSVALIVCSTNLNYYVGA